MMIQAVVPMSVSSSGVSVQNCTPAWMKWAVWA
jgi:hypothetical protein